MSQTRVEIDPTASTEKRPVALLDVDYTIMNMNDGGVARGERLINSALLDALQEQGVKDIYLFTNMRLGTLVAEFDTNTQSGRPNIPLTRMEIRKELTDRGFTVHGVITPLDIPYDKGIGKAFDDYYRPQHKRFVESIEDSKQDPTLEGRVIDGKPKIDPRQPEKDPEFKQKADECSALQVKLEKEMLGEFYDKLQLSPQTEEEKQAVREGKVEQLNVKGALSSLFYENKPEWVGSIIVADDEPPCLKSVEKVAEAYGRVTPCLVQVKEPEMENNVRVSEDFKPENYRRAKDKYTKSIKTYLDEHASPDEQIAIKANKYNHNINMVEKLKRMTEQEKTDMDRQVQRDSEAIENARQERAEQTVDRAFNNANNITTVLKVNKFTSSQWNEAVKLTEHIAAIDGNKDLKPTEKLELIRNAIHVEYEEVFKKQSSKKSWGVSLNLRRPESDNHYLKSLGLIIQDLDGVIAKEKILDSRKLESHESLRQPIAQGKGYDVLELGGIAAALPKKSEKENNMAMDNQENVSRITMK